MTGLGSCLNSHFYLLLLFKRKTNKQTTTNLILTGFFFPHQHKRNIFFDKKKEKKKKRDYPDLWIASLFFYAVYIEVVAIGMVQKLKTKILQH